MFYALIFLIAFFPFFEIPAQKYTPFVLSFFNSIVVFAIIYAASTKKGQFGAVLILGLLTLFLNWLPYEKVTHIVLLVVRILLYAYAIYLISHFLVTSKEIGSSEIYGATSLYLLLGLNWAIVYELLNLVQPNSFFVADVQNPNGVLTWTDLTYFSFVTLTPLGYGDITPVTVIARSLFILEAVSGIFCLAPNCYPNLSLGLVGVRQIRLQGNPLPRFCRK